MTYGPNYAPSHTSRINQNELSRLRHEDSPGDSFRRMATTTGSNPVLHPLHDWALNALNGD